MRHPPPPEERCAEAVFLLILPSITRATCVVSLRRHPRAYNLKRQFSSRVH